MTTTTGRMSKEEEREREKITLLIAATNISRRAHALYWGLLEHPTIYTSCFNTFNILSCIL